MAYDLLFQDTSPSWLKMIDEGATTIWERWEGIDADGMPSQSHNHYSKGAVITFLHRYTAGIVPLKPGYRRFAIRPVPDPRLDWAEATHDWPTAASAAPGGGPRTASCSTSRYRPGPSARSRRPVHRQSSRDPGCTGSTEPHGGGGRAQAA